MYNIIIIIIYSLLQWGRTTRERERENWPINILRHLSFSTRNFNLCLVQILY